ncbi:MAG: class II fructose-bisphosphate aldolase [Candidatus Cloacimonetes bacterium]|nr:class II fructose-bisphosphate aldolase [Candidatus Cloacimonadota bacterium]
MSRKEQIKNLLELLDSEIKNSDSSGLPEIIIIPDFHGEINLLLKYLADIVSQKIKKTVQLNDEIFPEKSIQKQLQEQNVDIQKIDLKIHLLGDLLDRGPYGIKCFKIAEELVNLGIAKLITGNHDLWAFLNLLEFHLPVYKGYDFYGNTESEKLVKKHWNDEEIAKDRMRWWAEKLVEYNDSQKKFEKDFFDGKVEVMRQKFIKYYQKYMNENLWNEPQMLVWEDFCGHFAHIHVDRPYVGLNGIGKTSVKWWKNVFNELIDGFNARKKDSANQEEISVWKEAISLAEKISQKVEKRLNKAISEDKWWWKVFNDINHQNYASAEWWGKDWSSHKGWGAYVIENELNEELQKPISFLIEKRDNQYLKAVNSSDTKDIISLSKDEIFAPGHKVFEKLRKTNKALIATNIVSYNQIEGHLRAAMKQNAAIIFEVARSQLSYALDENKTTEYIKKIAKEIHCDVPIVLHGDHIQYGAKLFAQKAILKTEYEKIYGEKTFSDDIEIDSIDEEILQNVHNRLKENSENERDAITKVVERLIKAGFTSIAIDASTIFDEIGGDAVLDYYSKFGTDKEKLVVKLEESFTLPLEFGVEFLKLNPETEQNKFSKMKEKIALDMKIRGRTKSEIDARINELQASFGVLTKEANKNGFTPNSLISVYEKIMKNVAQATIAGKISDEILNTMSKNQKLMLLPKSNAEETAYQLTQIDSLVRKFHPKLDGYFGKEIEVGHVDKKVPNPRRGGKMEAKMTHPIAVDVMSKFITSQGLTFDLIATNNGSGHGTDFDKKTLTPVSQVGKISPFLTIELQQIAEKYNASIAQHGTSGSDMDELAELSKAGVIKFNIATNYQQIILNVLSNLDDGNNGFYLLEKCKNDADALINGLHKNTRTKMKDFASKILENKKVAEFKDDDSLFMQFLKIAYHWGLKKGKINETSTKEDIATVFAKEFKRSFNKMDEKLHWNQKNYFYNSELKKLALFYRSNFTLFLKDDYGNVYTHGWLPVDKKNGKIHFEYKNEIYEGKNIWKGLEKIQNDIRDLSKPLSALHEALSLVNSWYADKSTKIKPNHIGNYVKNVGLEKIYKNLGVRCWFTCHNPLNKLQKEGLSFKSQDGNYLHFSVDKGMSWKVFKDLGGYTIVNKNGLRLRGFSDLNFNKIIDNPPIFKLAKNEHGKFIIKDKWENESLKKDDFLKIMKKQLEEELAKL